MIASSAADLRRYPASAAAYLQDGLPPNAQWGIKSNVRAAAGHGSRPRWRSSPRKARATSTKAISRAASPPISGAAGGALSVEDLTPFRAHLREPLAIPYRGGQVFATPELTGGPTLSRTLRLLQQNLQPGAQRTGCGGLHGLCARRCSRPTANA